MITCIFTGYNRPDNLLKQLEEIKKQSVPAQDVFVWYNKGVVDQVPLPNDVNVVSCNFNAKFHGRFSLALLAKTEYVAIFDDDVIPGINWFKNCLEVMDVSPGVLGTSGVKLLSNTGYSDQIKYGWNANHVTYPVEVDLVGHAWFFKTEWAKYMWQEEPLTWDNGEDIQFSYCCQKYGSIPTFVPPHPENDTSLWGNVPEVAGEWGSDEYATWLLDPQHLSIRNALCREYILKGWRLAKDS